MAFRLMLVGLVTCLALEPPPEGWAKACLTNGQAYWASWIEIVEDLATPEQTATAPAVSPAADPAEVVSRSVTDAEAEVADRIFEAVMDDQARGFLEDLQATAASAGPTAADGSIAEALSEEPKATSTVSVTAQRVVAFEPALVAEDGFVGEAYELNRKSDGTASPTDGGVSAGRPLEVTQSGESPELRRTGLSHDRPLVVALRLTGDAFHAWADVLQRRHPEARTR